MLSRDFPRLRQRSTAETANLGDPAVCLRVGAGRLLTRKERRKVLGALERAKRAHCRVTGAMVKRNIYSSLAQNVTAGVEKCGEVSTKRGSVTQEYRSGATVSRQ